MQIKDLFNNAYVINLDIHKDRLENFKNSFHGQNLRIPARFPGILGRNLQDAEKRKIREKSRLNQYNTDGHIGCGMSHSNLWKQCLKRGDKTITVFEDDISVHPVIQKLLNVPLPRDWDVIYLGHKNSVPFKNTATIVPQPDYRIKPKENFYEFDKNRVQNFPVCLYGYSFNLESPRVQKMINDFDFQYNVDNYIYENKDLKCFGLYPIPIIHDYKYGSSTYNYNFSDQLASYTSFIVSNQSPYLFYGMVLAFLLTLYKRPFIVLFILLFTYSIFGYFEYLEKYQENSQKYINLPGIYDVHPFDPFGNVWDDESKSHSLKMLKDFHENCKNNNLEYFIMFGTLLGWKRHDKKFIPWDDDLDVGMNEKDIEKLLEIYKNDENYYIKRVVIPCFSFYKIYEKNGNGVYPFIDIFVYNLVPNQKGGEDIKWKDVRMDIKDLSLSSPLQLKEDMLEGVDVLVPENTDEILEQTFSNNYMDMCYSSTYCHRIEKPIDRRYLAKVESKYLI